MPLFTLFSLDLHAPKSDSQTAKATATPFAVSVTTTSPAMGATQAPAAATLSTASGAGRPRVVSNAFVSGSNASPALSSIPSSSIAIKGVDESLKLPQQAAVYHAPRPASSELTLSISEEPAPPGSLNASPKLAEASGKSSAIQHPHGVDIM